MVVQRAIGLPKIKGELSTLKKKLRHFVTQIFFRTSQGRHKRNATFPGGQATTILQSQRKSDKRFSPYSDVRKLLVLCIWQFSDFQKCHIVRLVNYKNDFSGTL